ADTGAARGARLVVDDAGDAVEILTGGTDAGDTRRRIGFRTEHVFGLFGGLAPDVGGVADLGLVVLDPEVHGLGCLALEDHHIVAGELQLGSPVAAGGRAGNGICERALADDPVAAAGGAVGAGERPARGEETRLRAGCD